MIVPGMSVRPKRDCVVCGLMCGLFLAWAAERSCQADDERAAGVVSVWTADGEVVEGTLQSLQESLSIEVAPRQRRDFDLADLVRLRRTAPETSFVEPQTLALLVNGDVVAGQPLRVGDDRLELAWTATTPPTTLQIPLEFVRAIVFTQPEDRLDRRQLQRQWGLPRFGTDRLLLRNGTSVDGELNGIEGHNVLLSTALGPVSTRRDDIAAVTLNAELAGPIPSEQESSILMAADGSRITLHKLLIDDAGMITAAAAFGGDILLPLERASVIEFYGPRVQSLASLEPSEFNFTPFLREPRPLVAQRNVEGGPLVIRGKRYAAGLGVHSRSETTWELHERNWKSFTATIGIDDAADGGGDAVFRVAVDGKTVYDSGDVSGTDAPMTAGPLDVSGASELTLIVEFGSEGDIRDVADWCDPVLLR